MKSFNKWLPGRLTFEFLLVMTLSTFAYGAEQVHQDTSNHKPENTELKADSARIESLSPGLRGLLSKEMLAIQKGMMSITPAYAAGNWDEIANIANKIKDSYILKQSLTQEQKHELHTSLPNGFIKQDQHFHYLSGMLEHAASNKKAELVGFYFSKMSESCVSCHSQYAIHKFPALAANKNTIEHSH